MDWTIARSEPDFLPHILTIGRRLKQDGYKSVSADSTAFGWTYSVDGHKINLGFSITGKSVYVFSVAAEHRVMRVRKTQEWPIDLIYARMLQQIRFLNKHVKQEQKRLALESSTKVAQDLAGTYRATPEISRTLILRFEPTDQPDKVMLKADGLVDATTARAIMAGLATLSRLKLRSAIDNVETAP